MSANTWKIIVYVALGAAGEALRRVGQAYPQWAWVGMAMQAVAFAGTVFHTDSPVTMARMARLAKVAGPVACLTLLAGCVEGCSFFSTPKGAATEQAGVDLAVCVLNHVNEPVSQIVTDCGAAVAEDVVKILDAHRAAMARAAK